jgi:DNA-binding protein H-NS
MKTYADIKAEIAKLEKQANAMLKQERSDVVSRIREAIKVYGITAGDLGLGRNAKPAGKRRAIAGTSPKATTVGVPKYRDPATGNTWTGRGKPPNWIVGVKDREPFLITAAGADDGANSAKVKGKRAKRQSGTDVSAKSAKRSGAPRKGRAAVKRAKTPAVQIESGAASE